MKLKDCIGKINPTDAAAIQDMVDGGVSETEAVTQRAREIDSELKGIAEKVESLGGSVLGAKKDYTRTPTSTMGPAAGEGVPGGGLQATAPDAEGISYTQTGEININDAFWNWFGDSKVVDENGYPLVVYHGTDAVISDEFAFDQEMRGKNYTDEASKAGFFFASTEEDAGRFGRNIVPVYLKARNIKEITSDMMSEYESEWLRELEDTDPDEYAFQVATKQYQESLDIRKGAELAIADWLSQPNVHAVKIIEEEFGENWWVVKEPTQIKSINNRGTWSLTDPRILYQSTQLRKGRETLRKYGLDPNKRHNTRVVASALEARQREKFGRIEINDRSSEAEQKIARWMAAEVRFEMENPGQSGVGWYGPKFQSALDILARKYPDLKTNQTQRDLVTAMIAITSDGQKVGLNFKFAEQLYDGYLSTGKLNENFTGGGDRNTSIVTNIKNINRMIDERGVEGMRDYLLREDTVKNLRKSAREEGIEFNTAYPENMKLPMAALVFGDKLGAFYANLMGSHGYLTMDRWWSRSFNRYRGVLLDNPTETSIARFRGLLALHGVSVFDLSNEDVVAHTGDFVDDYANRNFNTELEQILGEKEPTSKAGKAKFMSAAYALAAKGYNASNLILHHKTEKAANTIYKAAYVNLRDAPDNASDRDFMIKSIRRAQRNLRKSGMDLSVADLQAILWYYEKRLYGTMGARQTASISFEEAALQAVGAPEELSGIAIEIAPDPDNKTLTAEFNKLDPQSKRDATVNVANKLIPDLMTELGVTNYVVEYSTGGYEDEVNPSINIQIPGKTVEELSEIGRIAGYVADQKEIVAYDESITEGDDLTNFVKIVTSRPLSYDEQESLYLHLRNNVVFGRKREKAVGGSSWRDNAMVIGDFGGVGKSFSERIKKALDSFEADYSYTLVNKRFQSTLDKSGIEGTSYERKGERGETGRDVPGRIGSGNVSELERLRSETRKRLADEIRQTISGEPEILQQGGYGGQTVAGADGSVPDEGAARVSEPPVRDDGTVELTHWGRTGGLRELDPSFHGKGLAGYERRRKVEDPGNWVDRTYFGIAVGQEGGYRKEALGRHRYTVGVPLERLYDWTADPDSIGKAAKAFAYEHPVNAISVYERMIRDAGYAGYWVDAQFGLTGAVFEKTEPESYVDETPVLMQSSGDAMSSWLRGMELMDASKDKLFKTEVSAPIVLAKHGIADKISMTKAVRTGILESHFEPLSKKHPDDPISPLVMKHLPVMLQDPKMVFHTMDGHGNISEAVLLKAPTNKGNPVVAIFRDGEFRTIMQYSGRYGVTPHEELLKAIDEVVYVEDQGTLDSILPGHEGRFTTKQDLTDEFGDVYRQSSDWYYSALTSEIEKLQQGRNSPQGWKQIITKNLPQKGVKKNEIEYTGVLEWLDEQEGKVTKEALLAHLRSNEIVLEDVTSEEGGWVVVNNIDNVVERFATLEEAEAARTDMLINTQYDMENYAMTDLDTGERSGYTDPIEVIGAEEYFEDGDDRGPRWATYQMEGEKSDYFEWRMVWANPTGIAKDQPFTEPTHFSDDQNRFGHARGNTRTINDLKTLHLEEIQDDYAQKAFQLREKEIERLATAEYQVVNTSPKTTYQLVDSMTGHPWGSPKETAALARKDIPDETYEGQLNEEEAVKQLNLTKIEGEKYTSLQDFYDRQYEIKEHKEPDTEISFKTEEGAKEYLSDNDLDEGYEIRKVGLTKAEAKKQVPEDFGYYKGQRYTAKDFTLEDVGKTSQGQTKYYFAGPDGEPVAATGLSEEMALRHILGKYNNKLDRHGKVPDRPFKDSSTWALLIMKRMIRHAAENGFEQISWTPGEVQVARWEAGLREKVDKIYWKKTKEGIHLEGRKHGMKVVDTTETEGMLSDAIGKTMGDQIINDPNQEGVIEGDDITISDTGMAGFYDKILVSTVNGFAKKFGAKVGVGQVDLSGDASQNQEFTSREKAISVLQRGGEVYGIQEGTAGETGLSSVEELKEYENDYGAFDRYVLGDNLPTQDVWTLPITPKLREAALSGLPLWQPEDDGPRGWYDPSQRRIGLRGKSDQSTFLHESGHMFLEMERMFAERYGVTADHKEMFKWMGVKSFSEIGKEHHEKFAETFEVYLRTGKAPSLGLRRVFASFARWLSEIYKTIKTSRLSRADLTPEMTGLFDRILATEEEIQAALGNPLYDQHFTSQEHGVMTDAQWKRYTEQVEKSEGTTRDTAYKKLILEWRSWHTKEWKEERRPLIVEEMERLKQQYEKEYAILKKAKDQKVDRAALIEINGGVFPTKFTGKAVLEGGVHPDLIAEENLYSTTKDMIDAVQATPTANQLNKEAVRAAQARMIEKHGDILFDGTIERELDEYLHNEERAKLLLMEVQQLRKKAGKPKINRDYLKAEAARIVGLLRYPQLKAGKYYRSEVRAAKRSVSAKTDAEALEAKVQELSNHYMYKEVLDAKRKMDSAKKLIKSLPKRNYPGKKYNDEYIQRMLKIANLYYGKNRDQQLKDIKDILEWYDGQTRVVKSPDGEEIPAKYADLALLDQNLADAYLAREEGRLDESYKLKELDDMTVSQVLGVKEMLEMLRHIAIKTSEAEQEKKKTERKGLEDSVLKKGGKDINRFPGRRTSVEKYVDEKFWVFVNSIPSLRNLTRKLDAEYEGEGLAQKMIYHIADKAMDVRQKMRMDMYKAFSGEMAEIRTLGLKGTRGSRKTYTLESGEKEAYSPEDRFMMGLYWGIESSRDAIRDGFSLTDADVMMILSDMTQDQLKFLNVVWRMNESLWPQLRDATIRRIGQAPPKLGAAPFTVNGVDLTGGHMRLFYDTARSQQQVEEAFTQNGSPQQILAGFSGSAIARVGSGGNPPDLDKNNIIRAMEENIHYIAWSDASIELDGILRNPGVAGAIEKKHGRGFYLGLVNNVQSLASGRQERESEKFLASISRYVRRSLTARNLMLSFRNTVQQLSAIFPAAKEVGPLKLAAAIIKFHNPKYHKDMVDVAHEATSSMEDRGTLINREAANILRGKLSSGKIDNAVRVVSEWGFAPQTFMDARLAYPVWHVRFQEELDKGTPRDAAIGLANTAVAESVGSGSDLHLGKIAHSANAEYTKMFTLFYSWFNTQFQRLYKSSKGGTSFANRKFIAEVSIVPMLTAMISALLVLDMPGEDAEDEEWITWFFAEWTKYMAGTYPIARDIASAFEGFTPTSPTGSLIGKVGRTGFDLDEILEDPARAANELADLVSVAIPIPGSGNLIKIWDCMIQDKDCGPYQALAEGPDRNK